MNRANYIIFHPDSARQPVKVSASCIRNGKVFNDWIGKIWVDDIYNGNEDPFVFSTNWLYSYCHASQLRRINPDNRLEIGSWLIFCSGDKADKEILCVDTVFEIGMLNEWVRNLELTLPVKFKNIKKENFPLWDRHFKFPFEGEHTSVLYTYESKIGENNSFLPLFNGERICIPFSEIPMDIRSKIQKNIWGKFPVNLNNDETETVVNLIRTKTDTLVYKDIVLKEEVLNSRDIKCKPC